VTAAEQYVAAAYLVVFVVVLAYVLIIAAKLQRLEQGLQGLAGSAGGADEPLEERSPEQRPATPEPLQHGAVEAQTR
jgi:CcmD family protein